MMVAILKVINAGTVPIQLKESASVKFPDNEAILTIRKGTKILNPLAALKPIPISIESNISKSI